MSVPFRFYRLQVCEGPGGWEVPLVSNVMATMEKLRIPPGTADDEVTKIRQQVIDEMAKMGFIPLSQAKG
eukprot:COSAG01_NODE_84_length_27672_cov_60.966344_11_plen_70_part_00